MYDCTQIASFWRKIPTTISQIVVSRNNFYVEVTKAKVLTSRNKHTGNSVSDDSRISSYKCPINEPELLIQNYT